jgi:hypothetical protein
MKGPMEELRLKALEKSENKEVNEAGADLYGYRFLRSHFHILASKEAIE